MDVETTVAPTPRPNPTPSPKATPAPTTTSAAAVYWGAAITGVSWDIVTPPMTLMEAVAYITGEMHTYGNRRSLGIYTPKQSDAISIATILYATDNFIQDIVGEGQYDHYHSPDRLFMEKYKHFHIWYGTHR